MYKRQGKLTPTVYTILEAEDDDRQWEFYCAITANPLADDVGTFDEFKQQFRSGTHRKRSEQTEQTMNNAQIKVQVEKSSQILNGFVPPTEGGD